MRRYFRGRGKVSDFALGTTGSYQAEDPDPFQQLPTKFQPIQTTGLLSSSSAPDTRNVSPA